MKNFVIAMVAFFGLSAAVQAADVSSQLLGKMGLGGMQQLSDAQGMTIRGMGDNDIDIDGDVRNTQSNRVGINLGQINQSNVAVANDFDVDQDNDDNDVDVDDSFNKSVKIYKSSKKKHRRNRRN